MSFIDQLKLAKRLVETLLDVNEWDTVTIDFNVDTYSRIASGALVFRDFAIELKAVSQSNLHSVPIDGDRHTRLTIIVYVDEAFVIRAPAAEAELLRAKAKS